MTMVEGDARVTIEFQLQTRRKLTEGDYTPFRTVFTSTNDDVLVERQAHLDDGYDEEHLRVIRVTTIEEVWKV
jgi:hypothetical protein